LNVPNRWVKLLASLALWLALAALVGLWVGQLAWVLVIALVAYLAQTLRKLYKFDRFVSGGRRPVLVSTRGYWPEIIARVEKLRSRSLSRKKRFLSIVRQVKESTDAIGVAGIILNSDREILWFNPAATRLLGLDPSRDIGQRIDNLIRHPSFVSHLREPASSDITIPAPKDPEMMVSISLVPYGREQFLAIARDVTHEIQLETVRRDLVANVSHELRSPLTVISGYLDTLADDPEIPPGWRTPIQEMLHQTHRMTQILRDLIELTRLETGDDSAEREQVEVPALLQKIIEHFDVYKDRPNLELDLQADADLLGNESQLHSIFRNLLDNAVRFTAARTGTVKAVWRLSDGAAVFEVVDNGIGIPAEKIPRLTERFYRIDPGRSRASGGTGLGLAIVKHALQRHGATLEIESFEGRGSTFRCRFPAERTVETSRLDSAVI